MLIRILKNMFTPYKRLTQPNIIDRITLDDLNSLVRTRHGWFLANRRDQFLGQAIVKYGECSEIEFHFLTRLLSEGDHVIEIGANIGVHTVGLAQHIGHKGHIIAVEPQPYVSRILHANLALNSIQNATIHECGCGRERSSWVIPYTDYTRPTIHNSGGVSLTRAGPGTRVNVIPLDDLIPTDFTPKLVKIDVEGMELDVLDGGSKLINKNKPYLYIENDRLSKRAELIGWVHGHGYRSWWHLPPLYNPDNHFHILENDYPNIVSVNMLCLPREVNHPATSDLVEIIDANQDFSGIPGF